MVDEANYGTPSGGMTLRIITEASELHSAGEQALRMQSKGKNEALVVLAESSQFPYFKELETAMKVRKFAKSKSMTGMHETIQAIIRGRQQQASACEKRAKEYLEKAIIDGEFYVDGERITIKAGGVKEKINTVLERLVESIYSKLDYVHNGVESDDDIKKILSAGSQQTTMGGIRPNEDALREVEQYLEMQKRQNLPTSMGDIQRKFQGKPFGWREIDIAALIATLISEQKVTISYSGSVIQPTDSKLVDHLRRRTDIDKTMVTKREALAEKTVKKAREFLKEYFGVMDIPTDEDRLIKFITDSFSGQRDTYTEMLDYYKTKNYPDQKTVAGAVELCKKVLSQQKVNVSLLNNMIDLQDDLLDMSEDMEGVIEFFKTQRPTFDSAYALYTDMYAERDYLMTDEEIKRSLATIDEILKNPKPYKRISELPDLSHTIRNRYEEMLESKRNEVRETIQSAMAVIHQTADTSDERKKQISDNADKELDAKKRALSEAEKLTQLDAMKPQIENIRNKYIKKLLTVPAAAGPQRDSVTVRRDSIFNYATFSSESDIDAYLAELRAKLTEELKGHDELHII